jgi:hypothetical protein
MNPPAPGLRRLWLNAASPAKVSLSVPPGSVLEVSDDVARQLIAADPHFRDVAPTAAAGEADVAVVQDVPKARKVKG